MKFIGTDEFYIGSTGISFDHRWYRHNLDLKAQRHKNEIVQNYYNKYGGPLFEIMEEIKISDTSALRAMLLEREQYYLDTLNPKLNVCPTAGSNLGKIYLPFTEDHKRKIGEASKGRIHTEETKKKIGDVHRGKSMSEESRRKMSKSHSSKILTEEHKENISLSTKGKKKGPFSDEHRKNISKSLKGKSTWNKGIPRSEETKAKIRATIRKKKIKNN